MTELEKEKLRSKLTAAYEASLFDDALNEGETEPVVIPEDTRVKRADRRSASGKSRHAAEPSDKKKRADKKTADKKTGSKAGKAKAETKEKAASADKADKKETKKKTSEKKTADKKTADNKKTAAKSSKAKEKAEKDKDTQAKHAEKKPADKKSGRSVEDKGKAAEKAPKKKAKEKAAAPAAAAAETQEKADTKAKSAAASGRHSKDEPKKKSKVWVLAALLAVVLIALGFGAYTVFTHMTEKPQYTHAYIAGTSNDVPVYVIGTEDKTGDAEESADGAEKAVETERLVRGTQVIRYMDIVKIDDVSYVRIAKDTAKPDDQEGPGEEGHALYVREENLASAAEDVVRETEVYVRTPVTIYAEESGPAIASFASKGSCLSVSGYDRLDTDGSVNKYKVGYTDAAGKSGEGYVYGKYVTDTQEKADAVYNENGIADKAAKDNYGYDLYGGKAADLDYYPVERPEIKGNEFCSYARAMYINCEAAVNYEPWVSLIKDSGCNAVVIDIKDGVLAYQSEVAKEMSPYSYETAYASVESYKKGVEAYKDAGVYTIGRIVVFNDPIYAKDHPENCIKYGSSTDWPSGYSRGVWEYNVRLAQEAIEEFGFNEIQFDYVRFPENSFEMSKAGADFRNAYGEEKGQAIQNFCLYAADQIHESGAYFSIDVFGESAYGYMTAYGQYWAGLSNVVDAISAMPYTDHMGIDGAWNDPYITMNNWGKRAQKQQDKLEHPAVARTWITGYDTPHWDPAVNYGTEELRAQIMGLEDAGLDGGFIPWNAVSSLDKYTQYRDIWQPVE